MVVETLTHLDEPDLVHSWLDEYSHDLEPAPDSRSPVKPDEWDQALGARERYADWEVFFTTALGESPWRALLRDWISRLVPGMMAYGTHGLIRTAHAVRGLESAETPPRLAELSAGLSIWAAYFQRLPGTPRLMGGQNIRHSLDTLPRLPTSADVDLSAAEIDDVRLRSIDTRDEHAIKFFDACLRETGLNPEPVYLRAAHDWTRRLLEARTWSHEQRIAAGLATV